MKGRKINSTVIGGRRACARRCCCMGVLAAGLLLAPATKAASPATLPSTRRSAANRTPAVHSSDLSTTRPASPTNSQSPASPLGREDDLTHLSLEDLMNVEVSSVSKKKQSIADAPAAVTVISQQDISRSGFSTIPDLLRLAQGVDVARINSYGWGVGVRGLNDQYTDNLLVLQDGRTLYTPFFAGVYWDTVDYVLEDLDRIEVIRGPGATLWGANAVNGVINITTKDSRETQGVLVSARGSNDDSQLSVRVGDKLSDDTTFRVYVKGKYDNELDTTSGSNTGDDWYSLRSGFRVDKHATENDTFTVQGDVANNQIREPLNIVAPAPPFTEHVTSGRYDTTANMLTRWDHRCGDDSEFSLQAYYDFLHVNYITLDNRQNTFDLDFHDRFKLGRRNEVTWGAGYRFVNSEVIATPLFSNNPASRNLSLYSAFVQDTYTLEPERWFVTIGSKFEHNDFTGFEVQPSARLLWTPNKQNSVWGAVSRAVRTPSIFERDSRVPIGVTSIPAGGGASIPAEMVLSGNPGFHSEDLLSYELGYRVQPAKTLSIDTTIFFNSYGGVRSYAAGTPIPGSPLIIPLPIGNQVSGNTYGAEISSSLQVSDRWRLVGSYSLLESNLEVPRPTTFGAATGNGSAPKNQAQLRSYLDITRNLQFNAGVFYVGRVNEFNIPGYVSTDLNLVWRPKEEMEVAVGVLNLLDNHHPEFGVTGGQGTASETPRTFYAQLSYKF